MRRSKYLDDANLSSQGNLKSQDRINKPVKDRVEEMEVKLSVLDHTIASLKIQIKFIADLVRKETIGE